MEINIGSLPFIFGALQALILIVGINIRTPFKTPQLKTTSLLLLAMMLLMCYYSLYLNDEFLILRYINVLGSAAWMSLAPAYFLFYKSYTETSWRFRWRNLFVFIIPFIFIIEWVFRLLQIPIGLYSLVKNGQQYLDLWMFLLFGSGIYYLGRCIRLHRLNRSTNRGKSILKWYSYALFSVFLVFGFIYVFIRTEYAIWFEISLIILSELFVFVLVYRVFAFQSLSKLIGNTKYSTESISDVQLQELVLRLEKVMTEQKPYLDKKLSLKQLSDEVVTTSNQLSLLFTEHYNTNFYSFVNKYRIEHLTVLLHGENARNYTVSALAEESGFNSKTTFYKVFKEQFGCTPSEYLSREGNG